MSNTVTRASHEASDEYAIIDLGSNSFHMFIARLEAGHPVILQRVKDKVRLARGLDENNLLSDEAMQRGLACLHEFAKHLHNIPKDKRQIVATATLRLATNRDAFITRGEQILGSPINVISGLEEADYIYRGATEHLQQQRHFIIDIGGASTEVIVGMGNQVLHRFSFDMGCVTFMQRFFDNHRPVLDNIKNAIETAKNIVSLHVDKFVEFGWDDCYGASGTPQALNELKLFHQDNTPINADFLRQQATLLQKDLDTGVYQLPGLADSRQAVFPAGLAILSALFDVFSIEQMQLAKGALREGLLFELANGPEKSNS